MDKNYKKVPAIPAERLRAGTGPVLEIDLRNLSIDKSFSYAGFKGFLTGTAEKVLDDCNFDFKIKTPKTKTKDNSIMNLTELFCNIDDFCHGVCQQSCRLKF